MYECTWCHDTFLVHLSLGNKVVYRIVLKRALREKLKRRFNTTLALTPTARRNTFKYNALLSNQTRRDLHTDHSRLGLPLLQLNSSYTEFGYPCYN